MVIVGSSRDRATIAMLIFNKLLYQRKAILQIINNMPNDMEYKNLTVEEIAAGLNTAIGLDVLPRVVLGYYKSRWPWSKAYARTYSGNSRKMELNSRKLNRTLESLCGSIAHEWGHCFEFYWRNQINSEDFFNHGDNTRKDNTFQYQLGMRVKEYVKEYKEELLREIGYIR